jgi:hypothetical protein
MLGKLAWSLEALFMRPIRLILFFCLPTDKKIVSINTLNGLTNWSYELNGQSVSNFIVDGNSLYVANLSYKYDSDEKDNEKNNEKNLENEKLYLRSINITSGIPYWASEIYFANGENR